MESQPSPDPATSPARTASVRCAGGTSSGLRRQNNEDRIHFDVERGLYIVVDGVGGQAAGETAAEISVATIVSGIDRGAESLDERLRTAIVEANNSIYRQSQLRPDLEGMGCVLTVAVLADGCATVGHVGDTRLYQWRDGKPVKVTHDHSPVGEQEDHGELSESEAMHHPMRNQVYRALGSMSRSVQDDDEFVEVQHIAFDAGSALLLCTDGLTDLVPLEEIAGVVDLHAGDPEAVVHGLIDAANRAGGKDNVSVIFIAGTDFISPSQPASDTTITQRIDPRNQLPVSELTATSTPSRSRSTPRLLQHTALVFLAGLVAGAISTALWVEARNRAGGRGGAQPALRQAKVVRVGSGSDAEAKTITAGLSQSAAGDTILVEPGEYRETVRVSIDVTLVSARPGAAVLLAVGGGAPAIEFDVPRAARLVGFTVRGLGNASLPVGILLRRGNVEVDDVDVSGTTSAAVEISNSGESTVRAGYFHDNGGTVILVRAGARPRIARNLIVRAGRSQAAIPAIELLDGASASLIGNVLDGFDASDIAGLPEGAREQVRQQNLIIERTKTAPPRPSTAGKRPPPGS